MTMFNSNYSGEGRRESCAQRQAKTMLGGCGDGTMLLQGEGGAECQGRFLFETIMLCRPAKPSKTKISASLRQT